MKLKDAMKVACDKYSFKGMPRLEIEYFYPPGIATPIKLRESRSIDLEYVEDLGDLE